jgi:FkbM family methyltransferase
MPEVKKTIVSRYSRLSRRSLRSLFWRAHCLVAPSTLATFRLPAGGRFDYPLKSLIGWALYTGCFEQSEVKFVLRTLKPGDTFVDVGANGGFYTVLSALQVGPTGHVYAFEPGDREAALLQHNVDVNGLGNVTIVRRAVSDVHGTATLGISADGAMNSFARTRHPGQHIVGWQSVPVTTLDRFAEDSHVARIDFVKIDVEGAERLVIHGAQQILARPYDIAILFEASELNASAFGYSVADFLAELRAMGLTVCALDSEGGPYPAAPGDPRHGREIYNFVAFYNGRTLEARGLLRG